MNNKITLNQMLKDSFGLLKDNILILLGLIFFTMVVSIAISLLTTFIESKSVLYITQIVTSLIQAFMSLAIIKFSLKVVRGNDPGFLEILPSLKQFFNYILSSICLMLPIMICVIPMVTIERLGYFPIVPTGIFNLFVLCVLLLIIVTVVLISTMAFIPYLIIDKNMGPLKALKHSYQLSKGYRGFIFLSCVIVMFASFLGLLALIIGVVVVFAWAHMYYALLYVKILDLKSVNNIDNEDATFGEMNVINPDEND